MGYSGKSKTEALLADHSVNLKKSLGQNFLIDENIPRRIAESCCTGDCGILEIGPGAGALTRQLALRAKKVTAIELDRRLKPVLDTALAGFDNVEVIYEDVLKADLNKIIKQMDCPVHVAANLPYYITSPVIMALLEQRLPLDSITVMVQKEAADRLCAKIPSRAAGAVTFAVNYFSEAKTLFNVSRGCFMPRPSVDSTVITLDIRKTPPVAVKSEKNFFKTVKAAFMHRRKTFINSVSAGTGIEKEVIASALEKCGISASIRAEQLDMEQFAKLSDLIFS